MNDFEKLIDFDNLYLAYKKSMKGKGKKEGAVKFSVTALEQIVVMKRQLVSRSYCVSPYHEFIVSEPKRRIVKSGSFRDKVLQHCLCDSVLLPGMKERFITDNYAGQIGKGTLFGLNRLSENLSTYYHEHGVNGYILKCDIRRFFYSIDHEKMKECVAEYFFDEGVRWVCGRFIDSVENPGLPLGNQCSQVFALMYLNGLDHMITEEMGCKYYGRYMDDFYLISDNKEFLKMCLQRIEMHLDKLHLSLNEKTEIVPIRRGIRFLGFHTYLTDDGKVIRKILGSRKRCMRKRLRKYAKLVSSGIMTEHEFNTRFNSMVNHLSHGNCYKLTESLNQYTKALLEDIGAEEEKRNDESNL